MVVGAMDKQELMRRVRAGEYVVDPHAVADAMLGRSYVREALMGTSEVLEPRDLGHASTRTDEPHPRSGRDAA
jgi:hypothetical protein